MARGKITILGSAVINKAREHNRNHIWTLHRQRVELLGSGGAGSCLYLSFPDYLHPFNARQEIAGALFLAVAFSE